MSTKIFGGYVKSDNGEVVKFSAAICRSNESIAHRNSVGVYLLDENEEFFIQVSNFCDRSIAVDVFDGNNQPIATQVVLGAQWKNISFSHYKSNGQKLQAINLEFSSEGNGQTVTDGVKTIKVVFTVGQKTPKTSFGQRDFRSGNESPAVFNPDLLFSEVEIYLDYAVRAKKPSTEG